MSGVWYGSEQAGEGADTPAGLLVVHPFEVYVNAVTPLHSAYHQAKGGEPMPEELNGSDMLTVADLAAAAGVQPHTIRQYRLRNQTGLPPADGFVRRRGKMLPLWRRESVEPWLARRATARAAQDAATAEALGLTARQANAAGLG